MSVSERIRQLMSCPYHTDRALVFGEEGAFCTEPSCPYAKVPFIRDPSGADVLIPFGLCDTVCSPLKYGRGDERAYVKRNSGAARKMLSALYRGISPETGKNCGRFLDATHGLSERPVVLVIGGGAIGVGSQALYEDRQVDLVAIDIYSSSQTDIVADAHFLPFQAKTIHGVWIQAVLEHVLDPKGVVAEISRVLVPGGIVYAETPFMQQVHEGAYDFTRFTELGHRALFREFESIARGAVSGPGTALLWSLRYLLIGIFRSRTIGTLVSACFAWTRFLDRLVPGRYAEDAACASFFLGRNLKQQCVDAQGLIGEYRGGKK